MVYASCYVYGYMDDDGNEILEQGRYINEKCNRKVRKAEIVFDKGVVW